MISKFALITFFIYAHLTFGASPNEAAPSGGNFTYNLTAEPSTLHPITISGDLYAPMVLSFVIDGLATRDPETNDYVPRLAEKWEGRGTRKVTFYINKAAKFSDGSPVTADDVKFSFEAIFDPAYNAAAVRPYYENVSKVEVIDPTTVRFTFKDDYFQNFQQVAELSIVPRKIYGDKEKQKTYTRIAFGSGPYTVEKFERGQRIVLKKVKDWWGSNLKPAKGFYNFDQLTFRFVTQDAVAFEMLKKGDLDTTSLSAEYYETKTKGAPFGKTLSKVKYENSEPKSYAFIAWNFKKELFGDVRVRRALQLLANREEMIKKFRYGNAKPAAGPVAYNSEYASPNAKPLPFDAPTARKLLEEAGWKDTDQDGILDKVEKGKKTDFRFTLIYASKDLEKYLTFYQEELKKSGIDMQLKYMEWNSFTKALDDRNFDATFLAWSGVVDWDPKQVWHTKSAEKGGSNFSSYSNRKVDKLIDQARVESNKEKRMKMLHSVFDMIVEDCPYLWFFNDQFGFYGVNNRIGRPADTFKFGVTEQSWWMKGK